MSFVTASRPRSAVVSATTPDAGASHFRADIEGLRAVAVLGVIAFHFGLSRLPGGFVGVDIFFVISGYLITQHLHQELVRSGSVDLWAFYARRARRLLPASIFVIVATLAAGYFILAPSEQQMYSKGALFASTYIINLWLVGSALDYFAPDAWNNPFIHFWSLSVEEQFYLAWPALLLLLARLKSGSRGMLVSMAGVGLVSLICCVILTRVAQPWAFYLSPMRAWEFAAGGIASMTIVRRWASQVPGAPAMGWVGLLLIAATYLLLTEAEPFPGLVAVVPVAGALLVLLSGERESRAGPAAVLALAPCQWVGKLSYSLYLWHWPVIVYAAMLADDLTALDRMLLLALTFLLSLFTYHLIENPVRRNRWLVTGRGRSLALAALLTSTGAAVGYAGWAIAIFSFTPELRAIEADAERVSAARDLSSKCVSSFPTTEPHPCKLGALNARDAIVLFGDSHADHWSTPLAAVAKRRRLQLVTYMKSQCPAARIPAWNYRLTREYAECDTWRDRAVDEIRALKPALVIVSEFSTYYIDGGMFGPHSDKVDRTTWGNGLRSSLQALTGEGIDVVVLRDGPMHKGYVDKCVARALWRESDPEVCDTPLSGAFDGATNDIERMVVSRIENARYLDLTGFFCNDERCPAMIGGRLTFRDRHHIATPYAETLAEPLERALFDGAAPKLSAMR